MTPSRSAMPPPRAPVEPDRVNFGDEISWMIEFA
jgi:hypothetical protein